MESRAAEPTAEHLAAINQVFAELKMAYHNQFHRAFPNDTELGLAKQLWLHALCDLSPARLRSGVRRVIKASDFLPSLHKLREYCDPDPRELGLPDTYTAYLEACRAPSPKNTANWSHPAVYRAGVESDWFFLANNPESIALPVFRHNYEQLIQRALDGENLDAPIPRALPEEIPHPLPRAEQKERLRRLRAELDI